MENKQRTREEIINQKHIFSWRIDEFELFYEGTEERINDFMEINPEKAFQIMREAWAIIGAMIRAEELEYDEKQCEEITKDFTKTQKRNFEVLRRNSKTAFEKYINGYTNRTKKTDEDKNEDEEEQKEIKEIESMQREADKRNNAAIRAVYRKKIEKIDTMTVPELQTVIKAMQLPLQKDFRTINEIIETLPKLYQGMTIAEALKTYAESEEADNMDHIERPF